MSHSKCRQEGSVLIIVLVLMMVAISLALYAVSLSRDIVSTSQQLLDKLQVRLESGSLLERLKYIGATGRFTSWNLQNLSANRNFPLLLNLRGGVITIGTSEIRLQDSAGRLGLWPPDPLRLKRLLLASGFKPGEVDVAIDSMLDWTDEDDLKHLNGAEKYYYRSEQSLTYQPRNDKFIQTIEELALIRGFQGAIYTFLNDQIIETSTGTFNLYTADASMLAALMNISLENASKLVQIRETNAIVSKADPLAMTGNTLTFMDESITNFPSRTLAIDLRTRRNEAGDAVHAIIRFRPNKDKPFILEKYDE